MKQRFLLSLLIALLMPIGAWAALAVGDKFTVDGMNFQVTSISPNEVQVGYNLLPAIDKNTQGAVNIPSSIIDSNGNSYSVTSISKMAFGGCSNLKSIGIPSSITSIGVSAFSGCNSLTEVHITDVAAYCQTNFGGGDSNPLSIAGAYLYVNGKKTTDLVIPEGVTNICKHGFWKCNSLTSVTIPKGVSISLYAFYQCVGLTSVTCSSSIDGECAFSECTNLNRVNLLDGVETIGQYVFTDCKALTTVSIPASVKKFDSAAFSGCTGLTKVNIEDIAAWCAIPFSYTDSNPLYFAHHLFMNGKEVKDLVIPEGVSAINSRTFVGCEGLTSVKIPTTVTIIGNEAFRGCTGLSSVNIPSNVTSIGNNAFKNCTNLTAVHITDVAAWCGIDFYSSNSNTNSNPLSFAKHLFLNGNEVTDLVIPEGVTAINEYVFWKWDNLASVSIPKSLTSIGKGAFSGCTGLTAVNIKDVAPWCAITFGDNPLKIAGHLFMNGVEVKDLVIPEGVTSISYGAFSGCKFNSVSIPSSLTKIDNGGLNANTVYIKDLVAWCKIEFNGNPLNGAQHLFVDGEEVKDLVIPEGVTKISDYAFYKCEALTSVIIGNGVSEIGNYAFSGCIYLKSVKIDDGVARIGEFAFSSCPHMETVTIGKSVSSIGERAFISCHELKTVISQIEEPFDIDEYTFVAYDKEKDDYYWPDRTLYVPIGTKSKYEAAIGWKFTSIEEMKPALKIGETFTADGIVYKVTCVDPMEVAVGVGGLSHAQAIDTETRGAIIIPSSVIGTDENTYSVTSINERAFQDCNELTSVTIPNTVTSIGSSVFLYDRNFTSIIIPKSVTFIGQGAFYGCRKLTSIQVEEGNPVFDSRNNCNAIIRTDNNELIWGAINTVIPNTVTSIGDDAFAQREITSVSIPSSVISIGNSAYYNCASFSTVLIPNSVISIGTEAFAQNGNLSEVTIGKSVKEIGKEAFNNKYIEEIHSYIEDPFAVGENTFGEVYQNTYKTGYLYVPVGTKAKYKTTEGWKEFKNIVEMVSDDDFTYDIGEGDKLTVKGTVNGEETTIEIPAKIVIDGTEYIISIIATNAFKGNTNLQSVTIPETIEKIGASAFADCKNLTAIHVLSPTPIDLREAAARGLIRKADGIVPSQFEGVNFDECVLYVPYGSEDAYHEAEGWKLFKQIVGVHSENDPAAKVTAKSYTREYGEKNPTFEFIAEGAKLDGEPVIECVATEKSDAGEYDIVVKKGSVKNYNDTYVAGKLTITKAPLKVSVKDVEREQGTENPQFEIVYEGWKLQDTESVLLKKPTATTTATKDSPVGEYDIIVSGGEANNYELSYAKGKLKVVVPASISAQKANGQPVEIYTTNGQRINKLTKGVNIIRDSSGKTRKVVKK